MWNNNKPKKLPVEVSEEEFTQLLTATRQRKHRLAFLLAWGSGLRISEVLKLQKEDFDLEKKEIRIKTLFNKNHPKV